MTAAFNAAEHLKGLKDFQRNAVEHVIDRFYGSGAHSGSGRFLVADETGLGKSVIARGVVARTVEELSSRGRSSATVLYICSNLDLAKQNLARLDITGGKIRATSTRLSELAKHPQLLRESHDLGGTRLNLVSFTPGTSFPDRRGQRNGNAQERALLAVLLNLITGADDRERSATALLLQGDVASVQNFHRYIADCQHQLGEVGPEERIVEAFARITSEAGVLDRFRRLRSEALDQHELPNDWESRQPRMDLIYALRTSLARAGAAAMTPDLVILDEFQRFRNLMAAPGSAQDSPAAELARTLFDQQGAKLLLLSATPYAPYTRHDEAEDHHEDFLAVLDFLSRHDAAEAAVVKSALRQFRTALQGSGAEAVELSSAVNAVRGSLLDVMSRSERPPLGEREDLVEVVIPPITPPTAEDLADWIIMRRAAAQVGAQLTPSYWKSVPHFSTFMSDYQIGQKIRTRLEEDDATALRTLLRRTTRITREQVAAGETLEPGNSYLRHLAAETVGAGWWKMLWLPASMPYLRHGSIYQELASQQPTKQLVFSAWRSVPAAISALLSHQANVEVESRLGDQPESSFGGRLAFSRSADSLAGMPVMTLFWPHPQLAVAGDPRQHAAEPLSAEALLEKVSAALYPPGRDQLSQVPSTERPWHAFFARPGAVPTGADPGTVWLSGADQDETDSSAWVEHRQTAAEYPQNPAAWHPMLPRLAAFAPGNIAYRCVRRIASSLSEAELWMAAWQLSWGLRVLFNRRSTDQLLAALYRRPGEAGQSLDQLREHILDYIADGDLEAVLDEFFFQLTTEFGEPITPEKLHQIVDRAVEAMSLRPVRHVGHDYTADDPQVPFSGIRFATRYDAEADTRHQGGVRTSFNSPFAPFVLASTSVGQEGIDFHWWCHRVVHWNLPSNPVDFEQREGRVNRFGGHAVRRNVAAAHQQVARAAAQNPWQAAFDAAATDPEANNQYGSFAPWWIYPGTARIQRVIMTHPHSAEIPRYDRLTETLAHYRLTLGQPRQQDLVQLIQRQGRDPAHLPTVDLRPPPCSVP